MPFYYSFVVIFPTYLNTPASMPFLRAITTLKICTALISFVNALFNAPNEENQTDYDTRLEFLLNLVTFMIPFSCLTPYHGDYRQIAELSFPPTALESLPGIPTIRLRRVRRIYMRPSCLP
jgi:hypothetical protein